MHRQDSNHQPRKTEKRLSRLRRYFLFINCTSRVRSLDFTNQLHHMTSRDEQSTRFSSISKADLLANQPENHYTNDAAVVGFAGSVSLIVGTMIGSGIFALARARGADFQVGGLTRTRKRESTRGGPGACSPKSNSVLKSKTFNLF